MITARFPGHCHTCTSRIIPGDTIGARRVTLTSGRTARVIECRGCSRRATVWEVVKEEVRRGAVVNARRVLRARV